MTDSANESVSVINNEQLELKNAVIELQKSVEKGDIEKQQRISSFLETQEKKNQELTKQIEGKIQEQKNYEKRVNDIESLMGSATFKSSNDNEKLEVKNFYDSLIRKGQFKIEPELETKYLRTDSNVEGGVFIPIEYSSEIIKNITEISPIRQLAKVRNMGSRSSIPARTSLLSSKWVGEAGSTTLSNSTYGGEFLTAKKLTVEVHQTIEDLNDSYIDMVSQINQDITEEFARAEGLAFVKGTGTMQPNGIMSDTRVASINSPGGQLTFDKLIEVTGEVKTGYNPVYLLNRKTLTAIRQIKQGDSGYLWAPGSVVAGIPNTLNGYRYFEIPDMDDIITGKYPVLFGEIGQGYMIGDVQQMTMIRDNFTLASDGKVRFIVSKRMDGKVIKPEALKKIKITA